MVTVMVQSQSPGVRSLGVADPAGPVRNRLGRHGDRKRKRFGHALQIGMVRVA
jgi:hypothetical protein